MVLQFAAVLYVIIHFLFETRLSFRQWTIAIQVIKDRARMGSGSMVMGGVGIILKICTATGSKYKDVIEQRVS